MVDSQGNVYQLATGPLTSPGIGTQAVYYASNIAAAGAGANTVSVTFTSPVDLFDLRVAEYQGIEPSNVLDGAGGAFGTGTIADSGTVQTSWPNDLLLAASFTPAALAGAGAGYTPRLTTPIGSLVEDTTVATAGSHSASVSLTASADWIIQMVAFRDSNAAPSSAVPCARRFHAPSASV